MKAKIAIEPNLTPVKDYLSDKGYQVQSIEAGQKSSEQIMNFDAFVISGLSTDVMGIQDTNTRTVIVNANGLTPDQVYQELKSKLE